MLVTGFLRVSGGGTTPAAQHTSSPLSFCILVSVLLREERKLKIHVFCVKNFQMAMKI